MRVNSLTKINFQRRLRPNEEADFSAVLKQGKEKIGNTGHSMLIIPSASLPQQTHTGVGNLLDNEALKFFDFAKQYFGINYVQLLPEGNFRHHNNIYLPYSGSALDLGPQLINFDLLTTKEYGKLITKSDIKTVSNTNEYKRISFENIIPRQSSGQSLLEKAFYELQKADTPEKKKLLQEIESYAQTNKEWLEPKSIYEALSAKYQNRDIKSWNDFDKNLYNTEVIPINKRNETINNIKNSELGKECKFYEFKQFLAEKHLTEAKNKLNQKGIKLSGDMLIGFSADEVWSNPKAFTPNTSIGWGIPALNFETPEAEKLLRDKVNKFAQRYDGIRLDASWTYVSQPNINLAKNVKTKKEYGSKILDIIDDEIKKVKSKDFNFENIMHEFVAGDEDFKLFDNGQIKSYCQKRTKIQTSNHLGHDYGTAYSNKKNINNPYILGVSNHDSKPLFLEYQDITKRKKQTKILADILKIPEEKIDSYSKFSQIKLAEPMMSKNNMIFFTDALNILERYKDNNIRSEDYRLKVLNNYQDDYFKSLEKGEGLNIMDALDKAFVAEGLDKKEPELYKKIVKYKKILQSPEKKSPNKWISLIVIGSIFALTTLIYIINKNKKSQSSQL